MREAFSARRHPPCRFQNPGDYELFAATLKQAKAAVADWQGQMYFLYPPSWEDLSGYASALSLRRRVLEQVRSAEIPILDAYPLMRGQQPSSFFFFERSHYTEEGHRVAAEVAADSLRGSGAMSIPERRGP